MPINKKEIDSGCPYFFFISVFGVASPPLPNFCPQKPFALAEALERRYGKIPYFKTRRARCYAVTKSLQCYQVTDKANRMAQSNSERQAAYRARHLKDEGGQGERLNLVIDLHAKRALERLANCYGVTQRALLERLLVVAEREALDRVGMAPNGHAD